MKTMKKVVPILQDYYPERLHKFYVIGANWYKLIIKTLLEKFKSLFIKRFYRAAYAVVSTFMSKKTTD